MLKSFHFMEGTPAKEISFQYYMIVCYKYFSLCFALYPVFNIYIIILSLFCHFVLCAQMSINKTARLIDAIHSGLSDNEHKATDGF